jgi:hypothetical protein
MCSLGQDYVTGRCISVLSAADPTANGAEHPTVSATLTEDDKSDYFLNCPKFLLESDEYEVLDDSTDSVSAYHHTYTQNQFRVMHDGRLEI